MVTVSALTFEKIDRNRTEKQRRACQDPSGARYQCLSQLDAEYVECHMDPDSFGPLYRLIQEENALFSFLSSSCEYRYINCAILL